MPLIVTKQEVVQIHTGRKNVLRRAWHTPKYKKGDKIPVVLEPGGKAPFVIEIIGVQEMKVGQMTDGSAREEGFEDLRAWKAHWSKLYKGTNRSNRETVIYALRFRKDELVHKRRNVVDSPF